MTGTRPVRLLGWVFGLLALLTVPWTVLLALRLPSSQPAAHYDVAWVGFDAALVVALTATAVTALRLSRWLSPMAAVTGTMLLVDAWFDVVTAPTSSDQRVAIVMALCAELPLGAVCLWLAVTGQQLLRRTPFRRTAR